MPPRFKKKSVRKIVEKRVAKAIEKYEKTRADSNNTGGSGSTNTGGTVVPEMHGCSYKTFMNGKPHSFKGTEGVVGLKRWFEKMEQVFEICKCAEDDKTLGLANANQIPWSNVKAMMTTEYCPATEIQRMEQELWTLTLKGDDIEAYNNRFHELALMCHELVPTEKKKIERYVHQHGPRELVEQAVQGRAARIGESNKRKWEDNQRNNNNNNHNYNNNHNSNNNHNNNNNRNRNNNHHQQQNRRQENVRAYAAAPAGGKIYAGNLPKSTTQAINVHHDRGTVTGENIRSPVSMDLKLRKSCLLDQDNQETTEKIFQIKERLKTARSRQKSYADKRRKPLEFEVGDRVLLINFQEGVRTFHVSTSRTVWRARVFKCPMDEIEVDENLRFVEEPLEIVERDVKKLKRRRIPLVKVRWNSRQGAEYTWEREDQFRMKYPHLFSEPVPSSNVPT
ncbi:putative reverse transcriptase domain-containing protein [Tanacetum coccineum]